MTSTGDLAQALDACLERMRADGVDAETAASRFPALADELQPILRQAGELEHLPPIPQPTVAFHKQLAAQLAAAPPPRALREEVPTGSGLQVLRRLWRSTAVSAAAATAVVVFLLGGAVYASADALPGDALYPVKRSVESARLRLSTGERLWMHLDYADRRLAEALLVPDRSGELLAEFSREVTFALAEADFALADGAPQAQIVDPLLEWLLGARGRLVAARPGLPPTAWRAALALVDEAIAALHSERALSSAAVPRLADARAVLRRRSDATMPWRSDVGRLPWPIRSLNDNQDAGVPGVSDPGAAVAAPVLDQSAARVVPAPTATPVPSPTRRPAVVPPRGSEAPPTKEPTDEPSPTDEPDPTDTPEPSPTIEPPTPTATGSDGPSPTPTPPPAVSPTPTEMPVEGPPVIESVACIPQTVKIYGESLCEVVATDPDGDDLTYEWTADLGELLDNDKPKATYLASFGMGGVKVGVSIHVTVRDADGNEVKKDTFVYVVPLDWPMGAEVWGRDP